MIADIDEFPKSHAIGVSKRPRGSCHPNDFLLAPSDLVASATPQRYHEHSAGSVHQGAPIHPLQSSRPTRGFQTDEPSSLRYAAHLHAAAPNPGENPSPEQPTKRRASADHIGIRRPTEFILQPGTTVDTSFIVNGVMPQECHEAIACAIIYREPIKNS